jgi:D-alanyl-lipoteichoic acid acyltransferase DltB (MBOAT superfamily)
MTFDSLSFFCFLALALVAYWLIASWRVRKVVLLGSSYVFYGAWNPFFALLLIATTWFDYFLAHWLDAQQNQAARKRLLIASVVVNMGVLAFFKYAQFLRDTAVDLAASVGVRFEPLDLGILLPIGISFYTFESMSYVIDVYRRRFKPSRSLVDYGLFVTFFPHLVAGPILRYHDFAPQCQAPKSWPSIPAGRALAMVAIGLAMKVGLADLVFAPVADRVFAAGARPDSPTAWLGAFAFSLQVYCDFAAYSLCAIGVALLFGFHFKANFESPFGAVGMADLWTRWHISLSTWLRDYVFNPLGGYRKGRARGHLNLLITFLLCGLWHGAAWTYVIWGGLNGLFQVIERMFRERVWDFTQARQAWVRSALMLGTFVLFTLAVVFFRAPSVADALRLLRVMLLGETGATVALFARGELVFAATLGAATLAAQQLSARTRGWDWLDRRPVWLRTVVVATALSVVLLSPGFNPAFIYFQF